MKFQIVKLEDRIAPVAQGLIPSVDLSDPGVNGAEHGCPGLCNAYDHNGNDSVLNEIYRHGCHQGSGSVC